MKLIQNSLILLILSTICSVSYSQEFKLIPSIRSESDYFGNVVSINGDWAVVGAWGAERVFVFKRDGRNWIENEILEVEGNPSSITWNSRFGISVAISDNFIIVGDTYRYVEPVTSPMLGAAFIFKRNEDKWEFIKEISTPDPIWDKGRFFGWHVGISDLFAVVGKPVDGNAAYIYNRAEEDWKFVRTVSHGYRTGEAVSLFNNYMAIGSVGGGIFNPGQGSVNVYFYDGESWIHQAEVKASDGSNIDAFGETLFLIDKYLIVGDKTAQNSQGIKTGAAYIFEQSGSEWTEIQKLTPINGTTDDLFGISVSISNDFAIVGAPGDDEKGIDAGSAYVFYKDDTKWIEKYKILSSDGKAYHHFGNSVSISGTNAIVSDGWLDNTTNSTPGSAYIYSLDTYNTGIKDLHTTNEKLLSIYPNPTNCCFKISTNFNCVSSKTIIIFNTNGEKIVEKQLDSEEITIDLSNNAKGIYYMNVTCDNKQANGKVIIK